MGQLERVKVIYSGCVQGVGFRFTARRLAARMGLAGFVKNSPDGKVLLVLEGDRAQIESCIETISGEMDDYIRKRDVKWEDPTGEFNAFDIRF